MKNSNNPVYTVLLDIAREQLTENKKVYFADVVAASPFVTFPNLPIDWTWLRDRLETELGCKLTPLGTRDTDRKRDPGTSPEYFLPGANHPTLGYAMPAELPAVSMAWADRRFKVAVGTIRSVDSLALSLQQQGLPITYKPATMPVLTLPPVAAAE